MSLSFPWISAIGKMATCNLQLHRALYSAHIRIICSSFFPLQHHLIDHAKLVHTTKGWKIIAATGEKPVDQDKEPLACEEGKGAVLHSDLISKLQNCKSVSTQIQTFCSLVSIPCEEIQNRKNFKEHLNELFKPYFPRCKTHLFGSTINGLGFKGCDVDLCLQTVFDDKDYVILKAVPTLDSVLDGTIPPEVVAYMNPPYMLRFVRRILRRHCPDVKEPILLIKARCPILRFYNAKYDVFCDFSCENKFSLLNTRLLQLIHHLDERFGPLAKLIRYWGKYGGFVGDIERFNSYSFSLLVVYFLQNTHLPVLPPITEMIDKSEYLRSGDMDNDEILHQDIKNFESTMNTQSVEELLRDFFFFYMSFDFSKVIQPLTGYSCIPLVDFINNVNHSTEKFEPGTISLQDPFRHSFNATACANHKSCKRFLNSLIKACKLYQDETIWIPKKENWGICSLFTPPLSERNMQKEWAQDRLHKIALPIKSLEAISKVKEIIQYGLLFECTDLRVINEDLSATTGILKTLLKMHCKAYHNTWQGREWHKRKYANLTTNLLELEHSISLKLAKNKTETRRKILCEFQCECKINRDNESVLILELIFKEDKFPPIVAIFLKEFIPDIFSKLSDLD